MFEEVMAKYPPNFKEHINLQIWEAEQILRGSLQTKPLQSIYYTICWKSKLKWKNNISTGNIDKNGSCFFTKTVEAWIQGNAHTLIPRTWEYVALHDKRDFEDVIKITDFEIGGGEIIQVGHLQSHIIKYNF